MHCLCANIFGAIVLNHRFKIDVVVMIIWNIVFIINSVLTLQVSTTSLPHDCEPCEIKVVSNNTCSLHTCVCAGSRRVRVRLSGFRRQGISSTPGGFLKCPIPVRVCAEQDNDTMVLIIEQFLMFIILLTESMMNGWLSLGGQWHNGSYHRTVSHAHYFINWIYDEWMTAPRWTMTRWFLSLSSFSCSLFY